MEDGVYQFDDSFILKGLPIPPSANKLYANNKKTGGRFATKEYTEYKRDCDFWKFKNHNELKLVTELLQSYVIKGYVLQLDRYFLFNPRSIFTQKFAVKKMDVSNRIKAFDDAIAKMIEVDDKYFFYGTEGKIALKSDKQSFVMVTITPTKIIDEVRVFSTLDRLNLKRVPGTMQTGAS